MHRKDAVDLTVRSDTSSLRHLRREVDELLTPHMEVDRRSEFLVAVNEAVTNAIESHQRANVSVPVTVTIDLSARVISVADQGGASPGEGTDGPTAPDIAGDEGATPESASPPPSVLRGRGMHIIRTICPGFRVVTTDVGRSVVLPWG